MELPSLCKRGKQERALHPCEMLAYTGTRTGAEGVEREARSLGFWIGETFREKALGIRPEARVALRGERAHKHGAVRGHVERSEAIAGYCISRDEPCGRIETQSFAEDAASVKEARYIVVSRQMPAQHTIDLVMKARGCLWMLSKMEPGKGESIRCPACQELSVRAV